MIRNLLAVLGGLSLLVAAIAANSLKSDIQFILLMLGVIGGILGLGLAAVIDRLERVANPAPERDQRQRQAQPPPLPNQTPQGWR